MKVEVMKIEEFINKLKVLASKNPNVEVIATHYEDDYTESYFYNAFPFYAKDENAICVDGDERFDNT